MSLFSKLFGKKDNQQQNMNQIFLKYKVIMQKLYFFGLITKLCLLGIMMIIQDTYYMNAV